MTDQATSFGTARDAPPYFAGRRKELETLRTRLRYGARREHSIHPSGKATKYHLLPTAFLRGFRGRRGMV